MDELREGSGHAYIAEGRLLELTGELQLANNGGQSRFVARALAFAAHLRRTMMRQRCRVTQGIMWELLDMNGGRDEEGGDEHGGRNKPEHACSHDASVTTTRIGASGALWRGQPCPVDGPWCP